MFVSLRVFPEMAHLEERSCKGKSKLYFRDFSSEQECEKGSHFISLKPPFSRDGDEADVSSRCQPTPDTRRSQKGLPNYSLPRWADHRLHRLLAPHQDVKKLFLSKTSGIKSQKLKTLFQTSLRKHIKPHPSPLTSQALMLNYAKSPAIFKKA